MKQTYRARFKIANLEPHPDNPKLHEDVTPIAESIDTNGFFGAVLVQESRSRIIAGHGTVKAATEQGMTAVPVILLDVDDDQAKRILLADNRTAQLSPTDDQLLATLLESFDDLAGTGYTDTDLAELVAAVTVPNFEPVDDNDNPRLDERDPVECPSCSYRWRINASGNPEPA